MINYGYECIAKAVMDDSHHLLNPRVGCFVIILFVVLFCPKNRFYEKYRVILHSENIRPPASRLSVAGGIPQLGA